MACQTQCTTPNSNPLHEAVKRGDLHQVTVLLSEKLDPDELDSWGLSPLMVAGKHRQAETLLTLLQHGASVNLSNERGQTALHYVCCCGNDDCLKHILKFKPKLNVQDSDGATPLLMTCKFNHADMAKRLVSHKSVSKVNPNLADYMGRTPLHWTAERGDEVLAKVLVEAKADLNVKDKELNKPISRAIRRRNDAVLKVLMKAGCDYSEIDRLNGSTLTLTCLLGLEGMTKIFLDMGHDPDEWGHIGLTPLVAAVWENHVNLVDMLLQYGANPNCMTQCSLMPIMMACMSIAPENEVSKHKIAASLLQANADPNSRFVKAGYFTLCTNGRNCPVSFAIMSGYISLVQMLLIGGNTITVAEIREWMDRNEKGKWFNECELLRPIYNWVTSPLSLSHLCRHLIRKQLGYSVRMKVSKLPMPGSVQQYVNLEELDHIPVKRVEAVFHCDGSGDFLIQSRTPPCLQVLKESICYQ